MNHVSLTIDSRPENVPLVCTCAKGMVDGFFSVDKLAEIEQALAEAVNNCIEHAYSGSEDYQILIKYTLSDDRLFIEITDEGKPFDPEHLNNLKSDFDYDPFDIDNLPEGGFGLKVIKSCMDEVNYHREDGKNHWRLTKYCIANS
ncbi:MAG: ATP-binding protein [Methyloglobulus sp.]